MHQAMAATMAGDDFIEVGAVGVGDENLSEAVAGHYIDDALHAAGVEFVKDVVEQQYGYRGIVGLEEVELCESQGDGVGLALPVRRMG